MVMEDAARNQLVALMASDPTAEVIIDIEGLQVICANNVFKVSMKESVRLAFLSASFDPLDILLKAESAIGATAARLGYA